MEQLSKFVDLIKGIYYSAGITSYLYILWFLCIVSTMFYMRYETVHIYDMKIIEIKIWYIDTYLLV